VELHVSFALVKRDFADFSPVFEYFVQVVSVDFGRKVRDFEDFGVVRRVGTRGTV